MDGDNATSNRTAPEPFPVLPEAYIVPTIISAIMLVGVAGNSLVIFVIVRIGEMRTVTNYYIVNLATTDLAFLVLCLPFTAVIYAVPSWPFGLVMCKLNNYLFQVTLTATCLTLAALSMDRFCAIVLPIRSMGFRQPKTAVAVSIFIWMVSFLLSIPVAIVRDLVTVTWRGHVMVLCREPGWSAAAQSAYALYTVVFTYLIPLVMCIVACAWNVRHLCRRARLQACRHEQRTFQTRRVAMMVVGVVVLFAVCWLPNNIINLYRLMNQDYKASSTFYRMKMAALCLSYANSAMNPFVYTLVGENFRRNLRKALKLRCGRQNKTPLRGVMSVRYCSERSRVTVLYSSSIRAKRRCDTIQEHGVEDRPRNGSYLTV
ncbi:PREDICTED: G-protein coupled receptor 54-like [Branchiostoma belcheri]|uniref:G-protein coupled receptor 54-like n=1 Tax=Branchiostoma belcheri TaxID=7741 RepID=A0A6P4YLX6_BRABE|nr:PREDICTED: G-protein coupled receptor 54-like [Branchiostoma belcheri]